MAKKTKAITDSVVTENTDTGVRFSTGCSLLNLALTGDTSYGFTSSSVVGLAGQFSSGKSLIAGSILATVAHTKKFDDYKLEYNDVEDGFGFNIKEYFGEKTDKRLSKFSDVLAEDVEIHFNKLFKEEQPFVYVLDSLDTISCTAEMSKKEEQLAAHEKGTITTGTFGAAKPKYLASMFKGFNTKLKKNKSAVVIIQQLKDSMGMGGKTTSGGNAKDFFANVIIYVTPKFGAKALITKTKDGKKHEIGKRSTIKIKKNRMNGRIRPVDICIRNDYGIHDVLTSCEWLEQQPACWAILCEKIGKELKKSSLMASYIEKEGLEDKLDSALQECWDDLEKVLAPETKRKW